MLSVRGICKSLGELAIKDVSFEVQRGGYFVLLGASGVGKSVLLEMIAGLMRPDAGQVFLDGKDITGEKIQKRKIGLVFQSSTLFPHMTVYDNIAYPLRCRKFENSQVRERIAELAEDFAVGGFLKRSPETLSGGELQRISLARAVASEPRCLLLDEPISSLDVKTRPQIRAVLRKINARGQTIIHVTHDYTEAASLGTHIAIMENGTIAQAGTVEEIFQHPRSEFVARFVGIRNFFKGQLGNSSRQQPAAREFKTNGFSFSVLTDSPAGAGHIMVRSEDVTIGNAAGRTSARNNFEGAIVDIVPAGGGVEVIVDIGETTSMEVAALITNESVKSLELSCGKKVWVNFKASAVKYVEG
ncbi:MAG: ABC transporter ATP-binding protein [Planctomycetota bacterium]|jgi:molybdopterin-binding protein